MTIVVMVKVSSILTLQLTNIKPKIMTNKQVSKEIIISSIFLIIMFSLFTITLSL